MLHISCKILSLLMVVTVLSGMLPAQASNCSAHQYWDNNFNKCKDCALPCDSCNGYSYRCITCTGGYSKSSFSCDFTCSVKSNYLDFNKESCENCSSTCTTGCIESPINCNNCPNGTYYRPDNNKCDTNCPINGGYYISSTERRCIPCRDPNCLYCSSSGSCTQCKAFYYRDTLSYRCFKCPVGCRSCNENGTCYSCEAGWTSTTAGGCTCPFSNCRECDEQSCATCQEGFAKDASGNCVSTVTNCRQYVANSTTICDICEPGYTLVNNNCVKCKEGCRHCSTTSNCTACENGYFMYGTDPAVSCLVSGVSISDWMIAAIIGIVLFCLLVLGFVFSVMRIRRKANQIVANNVQASSEDRSQISIQPQGNQDYRAIN